MSRAGFIEPRRIWALMRCVPRPDVIAMRQQRRARKIKESAAESALDHLLRLETQERVRAVLAELKPVQAQLLLLRASGHSYKELAEMLGLEIGTIGTRLIRAEAAFEERYIQLCSREEKL